jgi:putative Mn2+ efflux pump MntP
MKNMKKLLMAFVFTLACTLIGMGIGKLMDYIIRTWPENAGSIMFISFVFVMTGMNYYWMQKLQK